jgi:hypothetical protein
MPLLLRQGTDAGEGVWIPLVHDLQGMVDQACNGNPVARLVPIVSTAPSRGAQPLAQLYRARWPAQETIIRDWLRPLRLAVNCGYGGRPRARSNSANAAKIGREQLSECC